MSDAALALEVSPSHPEFLQAIENTNGRIELARQYTEHFVEYAFRHEKTGRVLKNQPFHVRWQQTLRENQFSVIVAPVEHAKTVQIGTAKPLHVLGNNPETRGAIISNTAGQAEKVLNAIRHHIERNPRVRHVFPHLRPSTYPGDPWGQSKITVDRETIARDPSIQALGVGGPLVGSRLDWAILDDVLDFENTRTAEQMQKMLDWFDSTLFTRLTEGAKCWVIGTPWNPSDLLHVLEKRPDWHSLRMSAVENPQAPQDAWKPVWFDLGRLQMIKRNMSVHNFARKYLCQVRTDETSRFQLAWIQSCVELGKRWDMLDRAPITPEGRKMPCFTGVDLGVGEDEGADKTVIFTIALDNRGRRIPVDIQSGRWQGPEILRRLHDVYLRYDSHIAVESNAAQDFIRQWAGSRGLPVTPFKTTAKNKWDEAFGVESIAVEMRNRQWVIPSRGGQDIHPEVQQWIDDMLNYTPNAHTGDHLMASWFARETARKFATGVVEYMDTVSR